MPPKGSKRKKTTPTNIPHSKEIEQDFDDTPIEIVQPKEPLPLILTSDKRRGFYECDYCRTDLSQVPRICCSVCDDFDICLDCFFNNNGHKKKLARKDVTVADGGAGTKTTVEAAAAAVPAKKHNPYTHGYRVCDSTRYFLFPSLRGVKKLEEVGGEESLLMGGEDISDNGDNTGNNIHRDLDMEKDIEMEDVHKVDAVKSKQDGKDEEGGAENGTNSEKNVCTESVDIQGTVDEDDGMEPKEASSMNIEDSESNRVDPSLTTNVQQKAGESTSAMVVDEVASEEESTEYLLTDNPQNMWTIEEDLRLLDAIGTLGLGNWIDVAEEVAGTSGLGTKTPKRCMERFLYDYLGKYGSILPEFTLIRTDNENGEGEGTVMNAIQASGNGNLVATSSGRKRTKLDNTPSFSRQNSAGSSSATKGMISTKQYRPVLTSSLPGYENVWPNPFLPEGGSIQIGDDVGRDYIVRAEQAYVKETTSASSQSEADAIRKHWEENRLNKRGGPTVLPPRPEDVRRMQGSELAGYMPRRGDFDIEWDNDAEKLIQDMEFSTSDPLEERQLKIKVLKIYNARLEERERRKQFLIDRNLLDYRKKLEEDNKLPADERDLVNRLRLFARFHSAEEHEEFIQNVLKAKRLRKEISKLQMYRRMGFTSLADAERFELDRTRREMHRLACERAEAEEKKAMETAKAQGIPLSSMLQSQNQDRNRRGLNPVATDPRVGANEPIQNAAVPSEEDEAMKNNTDSLTNNSKIEAFDIKNLPGYELLSKKEIELCQRIEMVPKLYLEVKDALIRQSLAADLLDDERSSERTVHMVDVKKKGDVYDFILKSGWIPSLPSSS